MTEKYKVAVFVGSLRKASYSRVTAKTLIALAPASLSFEIVEIGQLPLYNQDLEDAPPAAWVEFRERVRRADAFLFVTPEYNRSVPAVLKNAIDVGSRPPSQSPWNGKPAAVVSVSTGKYGGFGANHHLRQTLVSVNVPTMQHPEVYLSEAAKLFDENGDLAVESTREFLQRYMVAVATWVEKLAPVSP